jgi:hypothetical protein
VATTASVDLCKRNSVAESGNTLDTSTMKKVVLVLAGIPVFDGQCQQVPD